MRALFRGTLRRATALLAVAALAGVPTFLPAQAKVATKQEQATKAFEQLTEHMQKLQTALKNTDPEKAKVIGIGSKFIQEKAIPNKMKEVKALLDQERWDDSIDTCKAVIKDLNKLIDLLLKGDSRIENLLKEIDRLEKFKERVQKLIQDQKNEKDSSARAEALEQQVKKLEKAKQDLDNLIKDQKDLRDQTNQQGLAADPKKATDMAKNEGDLKERAKRLAEDLKQVEDTAKDLSAKPAAGKPGDAKPGEPKPGDSKPGDGQPGAGSPSPSAGAGAAGGASQDMGKAQNKLQDNKPESSLEDMEKAIKKLEKAKDEVEKALDEAKRELLKLPFEQLSKKQDQTKVETDNLSKDMEKSESDGNKDGENKGPTPGKQNVQQAVPKQKSAAGSLKEYKPGKAKQDQQDAQDKLEQAKKALDEALAQLRQQLQDEVLRSLEERFGAMLAKQRKISAKTRILEAQKKESLTASGQTSKALLSRANELATGEFELASEAHGSLKLLEEDGTTAVFPDFVIELRDDLKKVGRRLQDAKTGKASQAMQKEIEDMLQMLIDALRQQIEQNEQKGEP
ncbi:MAG: hypothetical protein KDC87_17120 [Planctomycetes bacterium]|nr:hypothetical protein [Planctomycetota bacterium]